MQSHHTSYWQIPIKERKAKMSKKITLTLITIFLLASLASCSKSATPADQSSSSNGEAQESKGETYTETYPAYNQQLLPIISGKVASLQLDAEADGTTQQLKIGDLMAITLESNPSTGFSWFATSSNPDVVAQLGEAQYSEPQSSSTTSILGAAGTETLYFEATKAGTATLTMDYKRGWETEVTPEKTITITVEVK
jgi:predicted secreted protein